MLLELNPDFQLYYKFFSELANKITSSVNAEILRYAGFWFQILLVPSGSKHSTFSLEVDPDVCLVIVIFCLYIVAFFLIFRRILPPHRTVCPDTSSVSVYFWEMLGIWHHFLLLQVPVYV